MTDKTNGIACAKPCPFCGSNDLCIGTGHGWTNDWTVCVVGCNDCGARGPGVAFGYMLNISEQGAEAVRLWNERAA